MESYVQISKLNDFIFCPKSLFYHSLYEHYDASVYHEEAQVEGKLNHENIDKRKYSTNKRFIEGLTVYSQEFGLCGKIDIYDAETKTLIERKTKVSKIYYGYILQLYAQTVCMREMGYAVFNLQIRSLKDNKVYPIPLPTNDDLTKMDGLIFRIRNYDLLHEFNQIYEKCSRCIYRELCDNYLKF